MKAEFSYDYARLQNLQAGDALNRAKLVSVGVRLIRTVFGNADVVDLFANRSWILIMFIRQLMEYNIETNKLTIR